MSSFCLLISMIRSLPGTAELSLTLQLDQPWWWASGGQLSGWNRTGDTQIWLLDFPLPPTDIKERQGGLGGRLMTPSYRMEMWSWSPDYWLFLSTLILNPKSEPHLEGKYTSLLSSTHPQPQSHSVLPSNEAETEDKMVGWHHWLHGCESVQTPGGSEVQGSLECCR